MPHAIVQFSSGGVAPHSRERFDDGAARLRRAITMSAKTREERLELRCAIGVRRAPANGALHRGFSARARASIIAVNSDRRLGENNVDKKKHAVAASTMVEPDAAFR